MASFFRRAGSAINRFLQSGADPAAASQEFQLYVKDVAGVTQLFGRASNGTVYQLTPPGGGSAVVVNELWGPRITPHAADDEFNTNALDGSWSQTGFGGSLNFAARPAPYVSPGDNRASWENLRDPDNTTDVTQNSWLRIQPGTGPAGLWKSIDFGAGVPNSLLSWSRMRFQWSNESAPGSADADVGLSFFEEGGGGFSFAKHATINLNNTQEGSAGEVKGLFWGRDGGTITPLSETAPMNQAVTDKAVAPFWSGYVALQKSADDYVAYLIDDGGKVSMGVYSTGGLAGINSVALWCRGNALGPIGIPLFDFDFIRFYEGEDWIM